MLISRRDSPSANTNFFGVRSAAVKETVSPTLLRTEADELEKKEAKVVLRAATQLAEKEKHAQEVEQAAKTLRNEAALKEREEKTRKMALKLKKEAETEFKQAKAEAILKASKEIEKAEAAKDSAEQALGLVGGDGSGAAAAGGDGTRAGSTAEAAAAAGELEAVSLDSDKDDVGADAERDIVAKAVAGGASGTQQLGANGDDFLDLNAPTQRQYDTFSNLDPPGTPPKPGGGSAMYPLHHFARGAAGGRATQRLAQQHKDDAAQEEIAELEKALGQARAQASKAQAQVAADRHGKAASRDGNAAARDAAGSRAGEEAAAGPSGGKGGRAGGGQVRQGLAWDYRAKADPHGDDNYAPTFWEEYSKGALGVGGMSKWVPEDHPPSHPRCKLHDVDCDELFPWGKAPADRTAPPRRDGVLGDNLVGVFGQDDVVVPTEASGLIGRAAHEREAFASWPEPSPKNRDLLYGSARRALSETYMGVGDRLVPLDKATAMTSPHAQHPRGEGLADLVFGSWNQGFHQPHSLAIKHDVSMFDQPYRQHMAVASSKGHQVFKHERVRFPTVGDDEEPAQPAQ
jgi:hypothetical protein